MKKLLLTAAALAACSLATAKIPAPVLDDAAKAKAAETAAKTAWQGKIDGYLLCKSQDRVAAYYKKTSATKPAAGAPAPTAAASAAVAAPCADPGPFAYKAPDAKPLEAAGAHSPATTAVSPPSGKTPSAELPKPGAAPAKKS